jgi:membrane protein implicated in regulation of membrane protease activity
MSKKQEHPLLFILAVIMSSVIMLILLYTNIFIFFFVFLAVIGWNIGTKFRKRKETTIQPENELQKYITQIDNMMKER